MKINKITIVLLIIIISLVTYIVYDNVEINSKESEKEEIVIKESISLPYVDIYLLSDNTSYIIPIKEEVINTLEVGKNLKERLKNLYLNSTYFDIFINNYKLKGYKVNLDAKIKDIEKVIIDENIYIVFLKDNNTIGLFNYDEYFNFLNTKVMDNYNNLKDVLKIQDNKIIYLDGSTKELELK